MGQQSCAMCVCLVLLATCAANLLSLISLSLGHFTRFQVLVKMRKNNTHTHAATHIHNHMQRQVFMAHLVCVITKTGHKLTLAGPLATPNRAGECPACGNKVKGSSAGAVGGGGGEMNCAFKVFV